MKLHLILDRIEENVAVLTDESMKVYECPSDMLPCSAKESDAFLVEVDLEGKIISLAVRENPAAGRNKRRLTSLFNKNPKNKMNR